MQWQKVEKKNDRFGQFSPDHASAPIILVQKALEGLKMPLYETYRFEAGQTSVLLGTPEDIRAFFHHRHILNWMLRRTRRPLVKEDLLTLAAFLDITPLAWRTEDLDHKVAQGADVCHMLDQFCTWLHETPDAPPVLAAESIHALMFIHPFTQKMDLFVRWVLSLILIHRGYPPPLLSERLSFVREEIAEAVTKGLDDALSLVPPAPPKGQTIAAKPVILTRKKSAKAPASKTTGDYVKIGALAAQVNETVPTLRYWTKEGLLNAAHITKSGYHLYGPEALDRIEQIQSMKQKRFTLREIKEALIQDTSPLPQEQR